MNSSSSLPDHGRVPIHYSHSKYSPKKQDRYLTIALSVQSKEYPHRFFWAKDNAFALEYTPDPFSPELIPGHTKPFAKAGIPVRFHCRFFEHELGDKDPEKAEKALLVHSKVIDAMKGIGEPVVTVHLNLGSCPAFDSQRAQDNLTRLVEHGKRLGITVCLENLRRGPSSDPDNITKWASESGAMITLDVGHAVSSEIVKDGKMSLLDIIDMFQERLYEVHMYGKEEGCRHYPITDMDSMKPVVDRLMETDCLWWTIELESYEEALDTRSKLLDYLKTQ